MLQYIIHSFIIIHYYITLCDWILCVTGVHSLAQCTVCIAFTATHPAVTQITATHWAVTHPTVTQITVTDYSHTSNNHTPKTHRLQPHTQQSRWLQSHTQESQITATQPVVTQITVTQTTATHPSVTQSTVTHPAVTEITVTHPAVTQSTSISVEQPVLMLVLMEKWKRNKEETFDFHPPSSPSFFYSFSLIILTFSSPSLPPSVFDSFS